MSAEGFAAVAYSELTLPALAVDAAGCGLFLLLRSAKVESAAILAGAFWLLLQAAWLVLFRAHDVSLVPGW